MNRSTTTRLTLTTFIAASVTCFASSAFAEQERVGRDSVEGRETRAESPLAGHVGTSVQLNPSLVTVSVGARYRHVFGRDERGDRVYLQVGGGVTGASSYVSPSAHVEFRAHPIFTLRGEYAFVGYTGVDRGLMTFASRDADFSEAALDNASARTGSAHRAVLSPRIENRLGPLRIRARTDIAYVHTTNEGQTFYLPDQDTLVKSDDVLIHSKTDLLFAPWENGPDASLLVGPSLQSTYVVRTKLARTRLGGALAFTPVTRLGVLSRPTLALDAGINVRDASREGEAYGMLALSTEF